MVVIKEQFELMKQLLKKNISSGDKYRFIKYLLRMKVDEGYLLYHVVTGEMILLTDETFDAETKQYLLEHWFLVEEEFNEYEMVKTLKFMQRETKRVTDGINVYSIFTTTLCNANCFYCYEKNIKHNTMTPQIADASVDFMLENKGENDLVILWYGGEPLCNYPIIDHVCTLLNQKNESFISEMVTNAYLFTPDLIKRAKELWNLQIVRVTIDGLHDTYRKIKDYANNDTNPLERVLNNINMLLENQIHVQIRMHLDNYNIDEMNHLVDFICRNYGNNEYVDSYIHLLYKNHETITIEHSDSEWMKLVCIRNQMERKLLECGLLKYQLREEPMCIACFADNDDVLAILPNGEIIKCRDFFEYPKVGDVLNKQLDMEKLAEWKERSADFEKCAECELYPTCGRLKLCLERQQCNPSDVFQKKTGVLNGMWQHYCQWKNTLS